MEWEEIIDDQGKLGVIRGFLPDHYLKVYSTTKWEQKVLNIYGKEVPLPRLTAWYGEAGYNYSGVKNDPQPMTPLLSEIREKIHETTLQKFNSVLLNLYRDENDSVGWHSDDEPSVQWNIIASLSLGATRPFILRKQKDKKCKVTINLEDGDLVLMSGTLQKHWHHQIPKTGRQTDGRINLTFRTVNEK
jgi:alkylated DNA repair dioxygenase AlkB